MTANTTPIFTKTPVLKQVQVTAANTARDGSGAIVDVVTGDADGTRISKITIEATGTTTAGVVRLFIYDTVNTRLYKEILVTAVTPSTTVAVYTYTLNLLGELALILPSGYKLQASTHNAETFNVIAEGGSF